MLWIVMGYGLVNKTGTATLIGIVQAFLIIAVVFFGNQGAISLITYITPGILVDALYLILREGVNSPINSFMGGVISGFCYAFSASMDTFAAQSVCRITFRWIGRFDNV